MYISCHSVCLGASLKKEMNATQTVSLDLPPGNELRNSLQEYKKKFEDALDEFFGP